VLMCACSECVMSEFLPGSAEGKASRPQEQIDATIELLTKSLDLLDVAGAPPELGARVQDSLDAVARYRATIAGKNSGTSMKP
ncbi:MAG: hypothetical protein ACREBM_08435, partial [Sphingomicrobium sp.]